MPNRISQLPKVSTEFTEHIGKAALAKNEWMPCPQCGEKQVKPPGGVAVGAFAGASMMGCSTILFGFITLIVFAISTAAGIFVAVLSVILVIAMPFLGAAQGASYACGACKFTWTFKEAEGYAKK